MSCQKAFRERIHCPCNIKELGYLSLFDLSVSSSRSLSLSLISNRVEFADDRSKVDFLMSFPGADTRLVLFEADIYDPKTFDPAIQGCEFVFHVATPLLHTEGYQACPLSLDEF